MKKSRLLCASLSECNLVTEVTGITKSYADMVQFINDGSFSIVGHIGYVFSLLDSFQEFFSFQTKHL